MILKKIRLVSLGLFLSIGNFVHCQELLPELYDSSLVNHQIVMNGNAFQHASSLINEVSRKIIFGGAISDELTQRVYEKQNNYNRIGGVANFSIAYKAASQIFKSKPNWSWMVNFSSEAHGYAEYSGDILGLAMLGNKQFLGETVGLGNTHVQSVQFLSLGGGIHDRKTKNFITLNAILPQSFFQLSVDRGSVSFSEDGSEIDMILNARITEESNEYDIKGLGGALNFDFHFPFAVSESFNGVMKISGRNLGVYHLRKAVHQKVASDISYSGFQIQDFMNDTEMTTLKDTLGVRESISSTTQLLPGFIQIGKMVSAHSKTKLQSTFGVRMYTNIVYRPMVYAGIHYQPFTSLSFGTQATFGGYGNFRLGLYANYALENIMIGVGTEDILGAFLISQYGHSGLIRLAWKF